MERFSSGNSVYQKLSDIVVLKKYKVNNNNHTSHQLELLHHLQHEHNYIMPVF